VIVSADKASLTCQLPSGTGTHLDVVVQSDRYQAVQSLLSYAAPTITQLLVSTGGCVLQDQLTIVNCARSGGQVIEVYGENFGEIGATVFIGLVPCVTTTHDPLNPYSHLTCILPSGKGVSRSIGVVQNNGQLSSSGGFLSYHECDPGSAETPLLNDTSCTSCAAGSYTNSPGQPACLPCAAGRFNFLIRLTHSFTVRLSECIMYRLSIL
jgi:hypothetical protein